ncbi:gliding motility protein GldM [Gangjinia marincola]|uniref:Gliding motility protein GldM n=1 Tax=Gangjinia marincola TaxID=578463 RepID=A0ABN1ME79_9FLAO
MAGGKQTPRQKMINLMYLVFIAMLALNMSKEVLAAFGNMNEKLVESNEATEERNASFIDNLEAKVKEQPATYKPLLAKADSLNKTTEDFTEYVAQIKKDILATTDDPTDYQTMDKSNALDEKFFQSGRVNPTGKKFLAAIDDYRNDVLSIIGKANAGQMPAIREEVQSEFSTEKVKNREGQTVEWLKHNFEGFPLIASVTKLTQMQADAKAVESQILSELLKGELESAVSLSNYKAIVVADKTAFFNGENFKGKVVLGRVDDKLSFDKVVINGKEIESTESGQVVLDFPSGNIGEQKITGELQFKEGDSIVSIPVESSYAVIPKPNSAVISADKMNVLYRGVSNPMTISVPGATNVNATAPGLNRVSGANYVANVTNVKAKDINIKVTGSLPGGETMSDSKTFRIKEIPRPVGTVRGQDGNGKAIKMQKNNLAISSVGASLPDFDFELNVAVSGFSVKVEGQPIVVVRGQRMNGQAKSAINRAKRGSSVQIFDIKANIAGNSSYRLPPVSPVFVELTN